ncbi:hypothetical protein [Stenotrophomonas maltophilia]|uniref:hypothetical protein n=1 Tax=Stenotrophomonas maltophilia TaxID=40324 RepID=UPI001FA7960B|nr:hypothetical protein [Stenotrophomonas maltophilia]
MHEKSELERAVSVVDAKFCKTALPELSRERLSLDKLRARLLQASKENADLARQVIDSAKKICEGEEEARKRDLVLNKWFLAAAVCIAVPLFGVAIYATVKDVAAPWMLFWMGSSVVAGQMIIDLRQWASPVRKGWYSSVYRGLALVTALVGVLASGKI